MYTYFHGSQTRISDVAERDDICLAPDAEVCIDYATASYGGGWLHTITVDQAIEIADEGDLRRVAAEVLPHFDPGEPIFFAADDARVRAALAAEGFDAVEYADQTADDTGEHECLRVWNTALLAIADITEIEEE